MLVMAIPLLDLETAFPSAGSAPEETTHRQAHDLIDEGFGPGFNGPLLLVVDHAGLSPAEGAAALADIGTAVAADPNVGFVAPGGSNPAGDTTLVQAIPLTGAVLLDATIIRLILVPSTMVMFNRANWWLPGWLDRILPNVDIEGEKLLDTLTPPLKSEATED